MALPLVAAAIGPSAASDFARRALEGARRQVGVTTIYDGSYRRLDYPCGDVPIERGVCTDVIVRAFRHAGADLQVLLHEDMRVAWSEYPQVWGLRGPDRNIDHRRVANLAAFFHRHGERLAVSGHSGDYAAGDLVTWRLPSGLPHIGILSDSLAGETPLVIHNIGRGTVFEDVLFAFPQTGHYRFEPSAPADSALCE
jgi:uncharacterized protein YijF (DUF1287 family)